MKTITRHACLLISSFLPCSFSTAHHEHYNTPFVPRLCFLISTSSIPYIMTTHTKQNDNQKNREKEKKKKKRRKDANKRQTT